MLWDNQHAYDKRDRLPCCSLCLSKNPLTSVFCEEVEFPKWMSWRALDKGEWLSMTAMAKVETIVMRGRASDVPFFSGCSSHGRFMTWLESWLVEECFAAPKVLGGKMWGIIPVKMCVINMVRVCRGQAVGS